jgi:hypothetical protein
MDTPADEVVQNRHLHFYVLPGGLVVHHLMISSVRDRQLPYWVLPVALLVMISARFAPADDKPATKVETKEQPAAEKGGEAPVPLNKNATVLLDKKGNRVLLKTHVVLRQGALEMLCCLKQTKEHESILSLDAKAYVIHTALLALDAKPGKPVSFDTEYHPPTGQKIDIFLNWTDKSGKAHRIPARNWVRQAINRFRMAKMDRLPEGIKLPKNSELRYDNKLKELSWYGPMSVQQKVEFLALSKDKAFQAVIESFFEQSQPREMDADWVFAGSGIYKDEETGKEHYLAEDGDLICVANFGGAMIDVAANSSAENSDLNFEAYTDRIPPKETPVTVELIPLAAPAEKAAPKVPLKKK